jgi:hypothetical protein
MKQSDLGKSLDPNTDPDSQNEADPDPQQVSSSHVVFCW